MKQDGRAVVVLRPVDAGIVGAPHVTVFHPPSHGSQVTIEAVNEVGASVGDRVLVNGSPHPWRRNAGKLIGTPMLGLFAGSAVAWVLTEKTNLPFAMQTVVCLAGFLMGIVAGVVSYMRRPGISELVIREVVGNRER